METTELETVLNKNPKLLIFRQPWRRTISPGAIGLMGVAQGPEVPTENPNKPLDPKPS